MIRNERHLWYREEVLSMRQVTSILNNMIVRIVVDGDIVDVGSGVVGNIVSELHEEEHMIEDPGANIGDDEGIYVPAAITCGESERMEVNLLEM